MGFTERLFGNRDRLAGLPPEVQAAVKAEGGDLAYRMEYGPADRSGAAEIIEVLPGDKFDPQNPPTQGHGTESELPLPSAYTAQPAEFAFMGVSRFYGRVEYT